MEANKFTHEQSSLLECIVVALEGSGAGARDGACLVLV